MSPLWAHGRVYQVGRQWHSEAYDAKGTVYLVDDCRDWQTALRICRRDVVALDRIIGAGHKLKHSFAELVARAANL